MVSNRWDRLQRILETAELTGTIVSYRPYWGTHVTSLPTRIVVSYSDTAGNARDSLDTKLQSFGYHSQAHPHSATVAYTLGQPDPFDQTFTKTDQPVEEFARFR